MQLTQALKLLTLESPFNLIELKSAYRKAALKHHPDCGGKAEDFIQIDKAYDLLLSTAQDAHTPPTSDFWLTYWSNHLKEVEKKFRKSWLEAYKTAKLENNGLWYSTAILRHSRAYFEPKTEWFNGAIFGNNPTEQQKIEYREMLIAIAPNKTLAEPWSKKYFDLEFQGKAHWIFYLPPSRNLALISG